MSFGSLSDEEFGRVIIYILKKSSSYRAELQRSFYKGYIISVALFQEVIARQDLKLVTMRVLSREMKVKCFFPSRKDVNHD